MGANEDLPGLKERFGSRVLNVDIDEFAPVDISLDCLDLPWPFADDALSLVVFGEVLEHFPVEQSIVALREAARVSDALCVTATEDRGIDESQTRARWCDGVANPRTTVMTRAVLLDLLEVSAWEPDWVVGGTWGNGENDGNGWCVFARRRYERGLVGSVELPEFVVELAAA